jgi:hypothetical protein
MPSLFPFPGLSMFIHLLVIVFTKVVCCAKRNLYKNKKIALECETEQLMIVIHPSIRRGMRFVSAGIVTLVSIAIVGTAYLLISRSIISPYSNIHLARAFFSNKTEPSEPIKETKVLAKTINSISCPVEDKNDISLVDYLVAHNISHSFESRSAIAYEYGMPTYKGTSKENLELLSNLRKNLGECIGMNTDTKKNKDIDESRIRY